MILEQRGVPGVKRVVLQSLIHRGYERLLNVRNHLHDKLFGKPDAIVVGEHHYNMSHAHTIAGLIRKYKPEYVLMEAFNDKTPEELEEFVKHYRVRTLEDVCRHYGVSLEKLGIGKDIVHEIHENIGIAFLKKVAHYRDDLRKSRDEAVELADESLRVEGHVPKSLDELKKVPLYLMHPVALEILRNRIADVLSKYEDERNVDKIIDMIRHIRRHTRTGSKWDIIKRRRYDIIMSAVADVGAKVAGCDIKKPDIEKIGWRGVSEGLLNKISPPYRPLVRQLIRKHTLSAENNLDHSKFNEFLHEFRDVLRPMRDHTMFWNVLEYARKRNSDAPVMAIVGRAHTHSIGKKLKKANVNHRIINLPPIVACSVDNHLRR